jgi:hypothetical protein
MRRTPQQHVRGPAIGLLGRIFVGVLALPFGVGAVLGSVRGQWLDALLFTGMFLIAAYAAWTGIHLYARGVQHRTGGLPREPVHAKPHRSPDA